MAAVECNLESFLVKLRETRAVRGHGTPNVRGQRRSGRPASRTMTGAPTDFNYGIRAGKTLNFPIVLAAFGPLFRSTWPLSAISIELARVSHPHRTPATPVGSRAVTTLR